MARPPGAAVFQRQQAVLFRRVLTSLAIGVLAAAPARAFADDARPRTLSVFAAASLTDAFRGIARAFEKQEPEIVVELNLAGSPALVRQIVEGARADVFAAADEASMEALRSAGELSGDPLVFARNSLAIAVAVGNPRGIKGLRDINAPKLIVALCAPTVPAGRYAREAFRRAEAPMPQASEELDVRSALMKVELGEADAAVVYATDIHARSGRVDGVAIPDVHNVLARYPIARVATARHPDAARRFIEYVLSPAGQRILGEFRFRAP